MGRIPRLCFGDTELLFLSLSLSLISRPFSLAVSLQFSFQLYWAFFSLSGSLSSLNPNLSQAQIRTAQILLNQPRWHAESSTVVLAEFQCFPADCRSFSSVEIENTFSLMLELCGSSK